MRRAALCTSVRLEVLPELASRPTLPILSPVLFNQYEKFFVTRRAEQWRLHYSAPFYFSYFAYKLLQFPQHSGVNFRIRDHACASIRLFLARFELGLDE